MPALRLRRPLGSAALLLTAALGLSACASGAPAPGEPETTAGSSDVQEVGGPKARIALAYDGGLLVLDAATLEVVKDVPLGGFNRLNDAGDGRHVLVSTEGGFAALDMGVWTEPHGDHTHSYASSPNVSGVLVSAQKPGHAVVHDELTTLFDDATGSITVVPTNSWTAAVAAGAVSPSTTTATSAAHHGVAVAGANGNIFMTEGTEESRNGAKLVDASGKVLAQSDQCPGVHGEAAYGEHDFAVGCQDGLLLLHGDHFHKVNSPQATGRIGTIAAAEGSSVLLTDYRAEDIKGTERKQVTLVDTTTEQMNVVTLDASYTWRNIGRAAGGEALVYGTDGNLRVIDPATGAEIRRIQVGAAWTAPEQWQDAHPTIDEHRGFVYVTDPSSKKLHVVDPVTGQIVRSTDLPHAPVEMVVVSG